MERDAQLHGCEPILCAHLLRKVDLELIDLLQSLTADEWDLQTVAPRWTVRDVAAHLLDTVLRKLSLVRDSWFVEVATPRSPQEVISAQTGAMALNARRWTGRKPPPCWR